jgi:hypothetical protein
MKGGATSRREEEGPSSMSRDRISLKSTTTRLASCMQNQSRVHPVQLGQDQRAPAAPCKARDGAHELPLHAALFGTSVHRPVFSITQSTLCLLSTHKSTPPLVGTSKLALQDTVVKR